MAKWIDPLERLLGISSPIEILIEEREDTSWERTRENFKRRRSPNHVHRWKERISGYNKGLDICELCNRVRGKELGC